MPVDAGASGCEPGCDASVEDTPGWLESSGWLLELPPRESAEPRYEPLFDAPASASQPRSPPITSSMLWKRAAGSFSRQRITTASSSGPAVQSGRLLRSGGGGVFTCAFIAS
ncbi:MAG TPA: hypothetical protein DEF51_21625 [Myxococcales bacterium]|nr:hypothetical protein [Myxococcales bacterium]